MVKAKNGAQGPCMSWKSYVLFQGGLSEAQNGYGFGMIPGHGRRDGYLSSLA